MARSTPARIATFLASHPDWQLDGTAIVRTYAHTDFVEAMGFVTRVALLAERAGHHPDIDIRWNTVVLRLSTHSEGGVTERDFDLVDAIDS